MRVPSALLGLLAAAAVAAAAPPQVTFPQVTAPQPMPAAVATLTADRLFVVESKENVTLLTSPAGMVKVSKESGPLTVFARFADGGERMERRTYAGPHVFLLEPLKSGECELLVIPEKVTGEGDIIRRQLRVDAGEGPKPPPTPVDPPTPPAPAEPSPFAGDGLRVLIVYEKDDLQKLPAGQVSVLTSGRVREALNAKCVKGPDGKTPEWRVLDKDVKLAGDTQVWRDASARPRKSLPWVLIGNGKGGFEGPLPATEDEMLALITKYAGGK